MSKFVRVMDGLKSNAGGFEYKLDEGKIINSGTHKELLSICKEYKKLCNPELVDEK